MSTRSYLGIERGNGTIRAVYCHYDGHLRGVGDVLAAHWSDRKKFSRLVEGGGISCLGSDFGRKHDGNPRSQAATENRLQGRYDAWRAKTTTFYARDTGGELEIADFEGRPAFFAVADQSDGEWTDIEYAYLLDRQGVWWVGERRPKGHPSPPPAPLLLRLHEEGVRLLSAQEQLDLRIKIAA